jgi:hypothetical protein
MRQTSRGREWAARILIGAVLVSNLYCAILFIWQPASYAPAFELSGASGEAAVRGMGVLFLMWNVPYAVAFINPIKHRLSLWEAITMQVIGVVGESLILAGLPAENMLARQSITRFIVFDAAGLGALILAAWVSRGGTKNGGKRESGQEVVI